MPVAKKILFISHSPRLEGGAELSLLEIVLESKKRGYDCHVVLPSKGSFQNRLKKEKISTFVINYIWSVRSTDDPIEVDPVVALINADALIEAKKVMAKLKPDVVVTNTITSPWFAYVAKIYGIYTVMIIRELFDHRNNLRLLPTPERYLKQLSHTIDYFFFNSRFTRSVYSKYFRDHPHRVLYPTVKINRVILVKAKVHKVLRDKDSVSILAIGSIAEHKNQLEVVRSLKSLVDRGQLNISLTILGHSDKESYINSIKQFIKGNGLENFVRFKPFTQKPYHEIINHDIVVVPSLFEAFGRVTLEGQLLGRLVIGCRSGGTKELIDDGQTGLLYKGGDPEDLAAKIFWAISHTKEAQAIAKKAMQDSASQFIHKNHLTPFFEALPNEEHTDKQQLAPGSMEFDPIYALIARNLHVNKLLSDYAKSLEDAANTIAELQMENQS